jgi:SAM-dependent methyltransferase
MNTCLPNNYLDRVRGLKSAILSVDNPHHEKKEDALLKWVGILEAYHGLTDVGTRAVVNMGCGTDSLSLYFKRYFDHVYAVDNYPLADKYPDSGIEFSNCDFLEWRGVPDGSVDVCIDSCAATHFHHTAPGVVCRNCGVEAVMKRVAALLRPGGYFLITSDCVTSVTESLEFVPPAHWIAAGRAAGLELVGEWADPVDPYNFDYGVLNLKILRLVLRKPNA